ncbi:MAG: sodium-extruding oxaloacetate decarboxylase subunit alpha [Betaproteobacteria bacterium AqS2]|uniref:Sodium-extruding oxaloacetate decarboxylase subunit alpha n=1 Tax=Candidatus Amphirhobacter heronislandensis TaxID=1732024 RepID=A0A930Y154_9GAMM|nr:sodium-extruding oxaloacetate decarboxylase subunit alpha [Betaproteobacteria bacterium AqS2]
MNSAKKKAAAAGGKPVGVTELVLRDGHQSLIATRMRLDDMLPVCERLDRVGFWSLEAWGGATFDACVRFLREDPWERLRKLRGVLPNTRLQMLLRGQNLLGYRHYADDVVRAFVAKAAENGIDVFRVFDALNDFRNMEVCLKAVKEAGKHAQGAISYTTSPVHETGGFVDLAKRFADAGCDSVAIKDMAGIMTPPACFELVARLKDEVGLPVAVHSHYTSGLAGMCMLRAVEAGADVIDTAISPFAEGASHPATETVCAALRGTERDPGLDPAQLDSIADYFRVVRRKYWQYESDFTGVDPRVLKHHVPGGMISNLTNQLKEQGALGQIDEVLEEIPRVRADLGYPPLVTPTSQIVGTQAVFNVVGGGKRYQTVTNEVKNLLRGLYGATPGKVDEQVRKDAVGDEEVIDCRPADLLGGAELDKIRAEAGSLATSEEDVLTYAMFPEIAKAYLQERAAGQLKPEELLPPPAPGEAPRAEGEVPSEFRITLHGETFHIKLTGAGLKSAEQRPLYFNVDGVTEEVLIETLDQAPAAAGPAATAGAGGGRPRASEPGHVATPMPGNVVQVLVKEGQAVKEGEPVLVIEAMKMENEIAAPIAGTVVAILVSVGDAVKPNEVLVEIHKKGK